MSGRVLITGGCGFVGVNLGRLLIDRGWTVVAYDSLVAGSRSDAERVGMAVVEGDVRDAETLAAAAGHADLVVHLAAHTSVIDSIEQPALDLDVNVTGTLNALVAARDAGARHFVFASSNAPLGSAPAPSREDVLPQPLSPYGASKLAGEALCSAFRASYGLPATVLRFSNVYGPYSYHKGSVVALFMRRLLRGDGLTIYGDGEQTRDFVHVTDLCQGIFAALGLDSAGDTYHLASGTETTVNSLASAMFELFPDHPGQIEYVQARPGEVLRSYSDISKARADLRFTPTIDLPSGLAETKLWFLEEYGE